MQDDPNMIDTTDPTAAAPLPWTRVLLVASLVLNLLVLGAVGGALWHGGPHHDDRTGRHGRAGGPLTRSLSAEDRHAILKQMRAARGQRGEARARLDAAMTALVADLRARPFDRDSAARHLAEQRSFLSERIARGQTLLLDRLANMTDAEREAYADRLKSELETPRRGHGRD